MSDTAVATDVVMPSLTDGMEAGTIITWLMADGAAVSAGDELLEIETDKATATHAAEASGVLRILVAVGETVDVGRVIARIGAADDTPQPAAAPAPAAALEPVAAPEPAAAQDADPAPTAGPELRASPVARRMAREHGVDLASLEGTGPGSRIVRADVERAAGVTPTPAPSAPAPPAVPSSDSPKGAVTAEQLTRVQQVVARRMTESKATAPEFVIGVEVDMEEAIALRTRLAALSGEEKPPSYNDFIVKACALALREYPRANGSFVDGRFELYEHVNVGVAVAANDALVVPTIVRADRMSLGEIARESRRLAERVRDGSVTPAELSGGTFTVSNLGMFGISEFIAVINPPQAAILAAGEMKRTPVEHDGEVALRHVLKLRLTCDHRILYGADAAGFLRRVKELLQAPLGMAL